MADVKMVTVTVKKKETVHDGKGGFVSAGAKIEVPEETAKSLKERGFA